jgi:hypothetical protein
VHRVVQEGAGRKEVAAFELDQRKQASDRVRERFGSVAWVRQSLEMMDDGLESGLLIRVSIIYYVSIYLHQ